MLRITIPKSEYFDEETQQFIEIKQTTLQLEHSLVSISKWEAKWHKPFLSENKMTLEETIDYIRCMTITQNVDMSTYLGLTDQNIKDVMDYIDDPMTATTFTEDKTALPESKMKKKEIVTSELIYYWMVALNIPWECQKWHLSRLITLIRVCELKNQPPKKMSKSEIMSRNRALNAARRNKLNSRG